MPESKLKWNRCLRSNPKALQSFRQRVFWSHVLFIVEDTIDLTGNYLLGAGKCCALPKYCSVMQMDQADQTWNSIGITWVQTFYIAICSLHLYKHAGMFTVLIRLNSLFHLVTDWNVYNAKRQWSICSASFCFLYLLTQQDSMKFRLKKGALKWDN